MVALPHAARNMPHPSPHNHPVSDFKQIFLTRPHSTLAQTPASRRRPTPLARWPSYVGLYESLMPCEPDPTVLSIWKYALQLQRILRIYEYDKVTTPSSATPSPTPAPVCSPLQLPSCQAPSPYHLSSSSRQQYFSRFKINILNILILSENGVNSNTHL